MKRSPISKISKNCLRCGRPCRWRKTKFCSSSCWYAYRMEHPNRTCQHCGAKHRRDFSRYCSRTCLMTARGSLKTCRQCKKQYQAPPSRRILFCSDKCYREHDQVRNLPKKCLGCGSDFVKRDRATTKRSRFCSQRCFGQFSRGVNHPLYRGRRLADRGTTWKERSADARSRDQFCRSLIHDPSRPQARKEKLSVDHIVAYALIRKHCPSADANDLVNLVCLCRACHAKKTQTAEARLVRGDVTGFITDMNRIIPEERTIAALALYGFYDHARELRVSL